jgi:hypothetical protein
VNPRFLLIGVAILVIIGLSTSAESNPGPGVEWALYITHSEDAYEVGDEVNVTVHVFSEGEYIDPPNITFLGGIPEREINLTRTDKGLFHVNFTIGPDELDDGLFRIECFINDTDGELLAKDRSCVHTTYYEAFKIDLMVIDPVDESPRPGQEVKFLARFTYLGDPVDPDGMVSHFVDPEGKLELTPKRMAKGLYSFQHTLPQPINESTDLEFFVRANYTDGTYFFSNQVFKSLNIDVLQVWAEVVNRNNNGASLEMRVMDLHGNPVEGADILLEARLSEEGMGRRDLWINGTTDGEGRALFNFSVIGFDPFVKIYIEGNVSSNGLFQEVDHRVTFVETPWDFNSSLSLEPQFDLPLKPGVTYDLGFHMEYERNHTSWSEETLYVYLFDNGEVYHHEKLTTDSNGDFTVRLTAPSLPKGTLYRWVDIKFKARSDEYWLTKQRYLRVGNVVPFPRLVPFLDDQVDLEIGPMAPERIVNVTLDHPDADGVNETAWVYWGPIPLTDYHTFRGFYTSDWEILSNREYDILTVPCIWNGSAYTAQICIPAHVPNRVELFIAGIIAFNGVDDWGRVVAFKTDVMFTAKGPPFVKIETPEKGGLYNGTIMVSGTAVDDEAVEKVEVIVDGSETWIAEGTEQWSLELDTTKLDWGTHKISVRATDGTEWSPLAEVFITVDQPPVLTSISLVENTYYTGKVLIVAKADDDDYVRAMLLEIDGIRMPVTNGTEQISYLLDTDTQLKPGPHALKVLFYDGVWPYQTYSMLFYTGPPPVVMLIWPPDGAMVWGDWRLEGIAEANGTVKNVEVRIDNGPWLEANGTNEWFYPIRQWYMEFGEHIVEARAYDGTGFSQITNIRVMVNNPPRIMGFTYLRGLDSCQLSGRASDDGAALETVVMRIDGGEWFTINGTEEWDHTILYEGLVYGNHTIDVRCFDGAHYSEIFSYDIPVNHRPVVDKSSITQGKGRSGWLKFTGSAADEDGGIEKIKYRIDDDDWIDVNTTGEWTIEIKEDDFSKGEHTMEIRAYDGQVLSDTVSFNFTIGGFEPAPMRSYVIVGVTCVLVLMAALAFRNYHKRV